MKAKHTTQRQMTFDGQSIIQPALALDIPAPVLDHRAMLAEAETAIRAAYTQTEPVVLTFDRAERDAMEADNRRIADEGDPLGAWTWEEWRQCLIAPMSLEGDRRQLRGLVTEEERIEA